MSRNGEAAPARPLREVVADQHRHAEFTCTCQTARDAALLNSRELRPAGDPLQTARWFSEVDRAAQRYEQILACEAVGHFLRGGKRGPAMFELPPSLRQAA